MRHNRPKNFTKAQRVGYAAGGAVTYDEYGRPIDPNTDIGMKTPDAAPVRADDSVYGSTAPAWDPAAYQASLISSATGYANGGAVRQGFKFGGSVNADPLEDVTRDPEVRAREKAQVQRRKQADAQAASGPVDDPGIVQGTNAALGGAGSKPNDPGSMQALADYSGVSAGYAGGGMVGDDSPSQDTEGQPPTKPFTKVRVGKGKKKARTGYAEGGAVEDGPTATEKRTVKEDPRIRRSVPSADSAFGSMDPYYAKYDRGTTESRTGYAEGGPVFDDPSGAASPIPVEPDPAAEAARREAAEQARIIAEQRTAQEAAAQRQAAEQRQQADAAALQTRDTVPPPAPPTAPVSPAVAPQTPADADVARQASDTAALASRGPAPQPQPQPETSTTPWYRQVYDGLVSRLQSDASAAEEGRGGPEAPQTGYAKDLAGLQAEGAKQKEIAATPFTPGGSSEGFFDPRRDAAPPEKEEFVKRLNPYDRRENIGPVPGEKFMDHTAEVTKSGWLAKLLGGDGQHTISELNDIQKADPGRDIQGHVQDLWRKYELAGDKGNAERLLQTVRGGYDTATSVAVDRLNNGDLAGSLKATEHALNLFPNDTKYTARQTPDGQVQIQSIPEKPGMGEPSVINMSPAQYRDFMNSNGAQFDHLLHNGIKESLDMATGKNKPMRVPDPREDYANRPGYADNRPVDSKGDYVSSTASGFHPDSHMGLMDRAQEAEKYGRPDPEAEQYAARAKALVRSGVAPADVPDALRRGVDPFAKPAGDAAPTNAPVPGGVARVGGKLTYDPIYDIPGSRSPDTPIDVSGVDPGDTRRIGAGDTFRSREAERHAQSTEQHETHGKGGGGSGSKQSTDDSSDVSNTLYPKEHWREPDPIPYAYGERRAGSQAQGRPEDYAPISKTQGPPVPAGFQPPETERDVFERGRGGGGNAIAPPNRTNSREDVLRYNAQLAERQQLYQPAGRGDAAYEARNRQLNETSGYAASQDRQAAELKRATAESDARYKADQADYDRIRSKYGYHTPELAAQDKAGNAPPIRYTDDWRHLPRPPTAQEQAQDIANQRQNQQIGMKTGSAEKVADIKTTGANARASQRSDDRRYSTDTISRDRQTHQAFLEQKATNDLIERYASNDQKAAIGSIRTKLARGTALNEGETQLQNDLIARANAHGIAIPAAPGAAGSAPAAPAAPAAQTMPGTPAQTMPGTPAQTMPASGARRVSSMAEAMALPPGTVFVSPDGVVRTR